MKIINYVGTEGDCIVIEKATDLYAILDWVQSTMICMSEKGHTDKIKLDKCIDYINELLNDVESKGFGNFEDVDNINWE